MNMLCCHQAASATSEGGNRMDVIDLDVACIVLCVHRTTGWADAYSFNIKEYGDLSVRTLDDEHMDWTD